MYACGLPVLFRLDSGLSARQMWSNYGAKAFETVQSSTFRSCACAGCHSNDTLSLNTMASAAYDVAVHSGGGAAGRRSRAKASFTRSAGRMRAVVFRACKLRGLALEAKAYKAIASVLRQYVCEGVGVFLWCMFSHTHCVWSCLDPERMIHRRLCRRCWRHCKHTSRSEVVVALSRLVMWRQWSR